MTGIYHPSKLKIPDPVVVTIKGFMTLSAQDDEPFGPDIISAW